MAHVLAFYRDQLPDAIVIPDDKLETVDKVLTKRQGMKIGGVQYSDADMIGLFEASDWQNLRETLLTDKPTEKQLLGQGYQSFLELGQQLKQKALQAQMNERTHRANRKS